MGQIDDIYADGLMRKVIHAKCGSWTATDTEEGSKLYWRYKRNGYICIGCGQRMKGRDVELYDEE